MANRRLPAEIHRCIVDFADAGRAFAVAVVMADRGSTPRSAGTKAIIDTHGDIWGTIGGGLLEHNVQKLAVTLIQSGEPAIFDFGFAGSSAADNAPVCGGTMRVLVDPRPAVWRDVYAQAADARAQRRHGVLVTAMADGRVALVWHWAPNSTVAQALAAREAGSDRLAEVIGPAPRLLIVGGGHVGQALAHAAVLAGFETTVIEDRPDFAEARMFPEGVTLLGGDMGANLAAAGIDDQTYVALVSRGHHVDSRALAACIASPAAYIGMMGSRRKVALMRKEFLDKGLATETQWHRLHAPIGLEIGAQTPEEIAAAIVAELIAARRGCGRATTSSPGCAT